MTNNPIGNGNETLYCKKTALKSANGKNGLSSKTSHIPYDLSTLYGDGWDKKADEVASDQPTKAEEENIENKVIDVDDTPSYHTLLQDKAKGDKYLSRTPSVAQKIHGMFVEAYNSNRKS